MKYIVFVLSLLISTLSYGIQWDRIVEVPDTYINDVMTADLTELECMALNIYHEARDQPLLGQQLVGQVTFNRMMHKGFPSTICGVVRQHKQFSWTHDGKSDHPTNIKAYKEAYLIAISFLVLNQHVDITNYHLILNYHATYVKPNWPNLTPVLLYGDHIFYIRNRYLDRRDG